MKSSVLKPKKTVVSCTTAVQFEPSTPPPASPQRAFAGKRPVSGSAEFDLAGGFFGSGDFGCGFSLWGKVGVGKLVNFDEWKAFKTLSRSFVQVRTK